MKLLRKLIYLFLLLLLFGVIFAFGYYYAVTKNVRLEHEKLTVHHRNILVYDQENCVVKNNTTALSSSVHFNALNKHTVDAFVYTEDKRFFEHSGFDVKRIAKAAFNNAKARSFKEGASTISQQLIKNTHLSQEKTLKRKLREWKLTRQLEKYYSKEQILEKYLNTIYFGHNCFGLHAAANFYFDKTPEELTLADSAILAGLVKSPNNYSPFKHPEACKQRKQTVLQLMHANGAITKNEWTAAQNAPLPLRPLNSKKNTGFMDFLFDELDSITEAQHIKLGGKIEIFTAFDPILQEKIEEITKNFENLDKSVLVLDGEKHAYKACVSTLGNVCRLPGSVIKPLLVYTPAFEERLLVPATPILDEKINFGGYAPENYDGKFHGYVSARECVEKSLNVPAVKVLQSVGVEKAASYMQKLNLPIAREDYSLALALGGMKKGFTLKDLSNAYSAFQNGGNYFECGFINEIRIDGVSVYKKAIRSQKVFSEESAYLMTDILKSTAKCGTAKKLRTLPFPIAAKTGTVGTEKGNTDAYSISYTAKDCVSVWLGNADNAPMEHTGGGMPCNLSYQIHEYLYKRYQEAGQPIPDFKKPIGITRIALDKTAYYDTHTMLLADELSPPEFQFEEIFSKSMIPLKKSDIFSNPSIIPPTISIENGKVKIQFFSAQNMPYQYKIIRYDYATHTTVYEGGYQEIIYDEIEENKHYQYTVIPICNGVHGKPITLPIVSTKNTPTLPSKEEILEKNWWEY